MIELKTPQEIEAMKSSAQLVAQTLTDLKEMTKVGTNLLELDDYVRRQIEKTPNAFSPYVDYAPSFGQGAFGHYLCTSVNDAVLHGVPYDYSLQNGDLLSIDLAINVDGWVGDSALSFVVGEVTHPNDLKLIDSTQRALAAGIDAACVGNRLGDISAAIGKVLHADGYSINLEFGGHGIGHVMHDAPFVPNDGQANHGYRLREGLVICIEPWILETTDEIIQDPHDGWTIRSVDGSRGAHSEHEIAITKDGPIVLTARS